MSSDFQSEWFYYWNYILECAKIYVLGRLKTFRSQKTFQFWFSIQNHCSVKAVWGSSTFLPIFEGVFQQQAVGGPRSFEYIWTCFSFSALGKPSRRLNPSKGSPAWTPPLWDIQKSLGFRSLSAKGDWGSWRIAFRSLLLPAFFFYTTSSATPFKNIVKE